MVYRKTLKWNKLDLSKKIIEVQEQDKNSLQTDLFDTLKIENRKLVSAPEVGLPYNAIAFCSSLLGEKDNFVCLFNLDCSFSKGQEEFFQTCNTIPGLKASIKRYSKVCIKSSNGERKLEITGNLAAEFQKSIDFLHGKNLLTHLSPLKRKMYLNKFKKRLLKENKKGRDREREIELKSLKKRKINKAKRKAKKK